MAEDRDGQSSPRAPVMRSAAEKQQRVPRPSRPDRPPRRLSSPKKTSAQRPTELPDLQDQLNALIMAPLQLQSTTDPSNRDQGASQPCARLRQLTAVEGGLALQRLYAIIQRQRDEWYQSNYPSTSPPTPMATPASRVQQNEQTPSNVGQLDSSQGRTFVTQDVVSGSRAGLVSTGVYTEPSRVITPVTGAEASGLGQGSMKSDQGQTIKTLSSEATPVSFKENQSVRFQTPVRSCEPLSLRPSGLVISGPDSLSNGSPLQEISGRAPNSTSYQQSGRNISGGTLEPSTFQPSGQEISGGTLQSSSIQRRGKDISGGTLQSSSFQRLGHDTSKGTQQVSSFQQSGQVVTGESPLFGSLQRSEQDATGAIQKSYKLQELGQEKGANYTQPKSSGQARIDVSGYEASGGSYGSLQRQLLQQKELQKSDVVSHNPPLQQPATLPDNQMPPIFPPPGPSGIQALVGSRPEAYHCDMPGIPVPGRSFNLEWSQQSTGVTSMQASLGSLQRLESPQSPGASGMQMSKEPSHQSPSSLCPAESGNQAPEGVSLKAADKPEGQYQYSPECLPQASQPMTKSDLVGETLRGHMAKSQLRREAAETKFIPRRRTVATANDAQTFEEQVSAEFQILKELALSLRNIRYIPTPVTPTPGTAFENCVLSEIRSIRSRCTPYSQSVMYNQPTFSVQGKGSGVAAGPQNVNQALESQDMSQEQENYESRQVSAFEQQVISALRSLYRSCEGAKNASVQRLSTSEVPLLPSPTRAFEELVLNKLNELETEFGCQQVTQPVGSPADPSRPNPEAVLPTTNFTSGTSGTPHASQSGATGSADPSQQDSNQAVQQSPQSDTAQNHRLSSGSVVDASSQPMDPSYMKASSKGTTPVNRAIGSLTFDTTTSSPAPANRTEGSGSVQNEVEPVKETTSSEDKLRREKFEAEAQRQPPATDQRMTQAEGRADQLPKPPVSFNVSWTENDISLPRVLEAPHKNAQMQDTIYVQPTFVAQQVHRGPVDRYDATTDECETGSLEDTDSDPESVDSCSPQSLAFGQLSCDTSRYPDIKRQLNQTFLECDYAYGASELAALTDRRPRLSMPARLPNRKTTGQGPPDVRAELTQYTMSETQPSKDPLRPDPQSISEQGPTYNGPKTLIGPTTKIPLSSTLKEGGVQPTRIAVPPELPSTIDSAPHRSSLTQDNLSTGKHDAARVQKDSSLDRRYGSQRPLPLETGEALGSSFDCSEIYYQVASNAPIVDNRYRQVSTFPGSCDQEDQESLCWDDEPNASLRSGFAAMHRYGSECTAESGFPTRPYATSMERAGPSRGAFGKACSTPWPNRAYPSGARNRLLPLQSLNSSCERPSGRRKTLADCLSRCSGKRNRRSCGKTFSRPRPTHAAGMDPRCSSKNAKHVETELNDRMMKCLGVAPTRSRYTYDPCSSSESESDCE